MNLQGMTAMVTGASRGIGRAIALVLAERGARVYLAARSTQALDRLAEEISQRGGKADIAGMDVSNLEEVRETLRTILQQTSRLDILVNNAGMRRDKLLVRLKKEDWQDVLDVNLMGSFFCMQQVLPAMSRARYGRIVNISSVVGFTGNPGQANYAAAKAGLIGLTKSAAREYATRGITVNAVAPGLIESEMTAGMEDKAFQQAVQLIPAGRPGTTEEVAEAVGFLVSPNAGYITGQVLHVNGGMYL